MNTPSPVKQIEIMPKYERMELARAHVKRLRNDPSYKSELTYRLNSKACDLTVKGVPLGTPGLLHEPGKTFKSLNGGAPRLHYSAMKDAGLLTTGASPQGAPLVRTDLDPEVYPHFVDEFPGFDMIEKEKADGASHTWNIMEKFDTDGASFVTELAVADKDHSQVARMNAPVVISLIERGVSTLEQLATAASGMSYNYEGQTGQTPEDIEIADGLMSSAYLWQKCFYQGTQTGSKTGTDEYGTTFANGFTGLREIISTNAPGSYYPVGAYNAFDVADGTLLDAYNSAAVAIRNNGGRARSVHMDAYTSQRLSYEVQAEVRSAGGNVTYGNHVDNLLLATGDLCPIVVVPGDGIGSYTYAGYTGGSATVHDSYVLDNSKRQISFAYLGSDTPTVLEVPIGADGTLGRRFLIFFLAALAVKAPLRMAKIRVGV